MIDRYTKAVLTLIGAMLCVISFQLSFRDAVAQNYGSTRNCGWSAEEACFITTQPVPRNSGVNSTSLSVIVQK
jgi:hypothetical protein